MRSPSPSAPRLSRLGEGTSGSSIRTPLGGAVCLTASSAPKASIFFFDGGSLRRQGGSAHASRGRRVSVKEKDRTRGLTRP